jgi:DNA-binding transcriptional LysR family regulator
VELRQVRHFAALAETLNFSGSGSTRVIHGQTNKKLYVLQPSLSLQIMQLEDELGVSLLRVPVQV